MLFLKLFLIAFLLFFSMDLVWLGVIAKNIYRDQIGYIMADQFRWGAALLFYIIYLSGILFFVILPSFLEGNSLKGLLYGALFGFVCYATYDLTNLATLKGWPVKIVLYDLLWGLFITGVTSWATILIGLQWRSYFK